MSDTLNLVEIDGQHVELLPARTVLSLFSLDGDATVIGGTVCQQTQPTPTGLLQSLGLGITPASQQCITPPVVVSSSSSSS